MTNSADVIALGDFEIVTLDAADRARLRRDAYAVWAWECDQSCDAVGRRLGIDGRTVRNWARADGWRLRFEQARTDLDPAQARAAIALRVQSAAMHAAEYLEAVVSGVVVGDKLRIAACKIVLDAAGFAGIRVTGTEHHHATQAQAIAIDYDQLGPDDLAAHEKRLRLAARAASTNGAPS